LNWSICKSYSTWRYRLTHANASVTSSRYSVRSKYFWAYPGLILRLQSLIPQKIRILSLLSSYLRLSKKILYCTLTSLCLNLTCSASRQDCSTGSEPNLMNIKHLMCVSSGSSLSTFRMHDLARPPVLDTYLALLTHSLGRISNPSLWISRKDWLLVLWLGHILDSDHPQPVLPKMYLGHIVRSWASFINISKWRHVSF